MNSSQIEIFKSFANYENKYFIPEILLAANTIKDLIDDGLVLKMKARLEKMAAEEWVGYASALVTAFNKSQTENIRIESLASIVSFDKEIWKIPSEQFLGLGSKAKKHAIRFLAGYENIAALDAIKVGLSFYGVYWDAAVILSKSEYGIELLLDYIESGAVDNSFVKEEITRRLLKVESTRAIKIFLDLLGSIAGNTRIAQILCSHTNEGVRVKAQEIIAYHSSKLMKTDRDKDATEYEDVDMPLTIKIINYQEENDSNIKKIKNSKIYDFPAWEIKTRGDGSAYFICPFCNYKNEVHWKYCKHIVYEYETVNDEAFCRNQSFFDIFARLISSNPEKYIEDFDDYIWGYVYDWKDKNDNCVTVDLQRLRILLENLITPEVISSVIETNGLPYAIVDLVQFYLYEPYMGNGIVYYLVSDADLVKLDRS